jgi:hypothetical protein
MNAVILAHQTFLGFFFGSLLVAVPMSIAVGWLVYIVEQTRVRNLESLAAYDYERYRSLQEEVENLQKQLKLANENHRRHIQEIRRTSRDTEREIEALVLDHRQPAQSPTRRLPRLRLNKGQLEQYHEA